MSLKDQFRRVRYWKGKLPTREAKMRVPQYEDDIHFQKWKPKKQTSRTTSLVMWSLLFSFLFLLVSAGILFVSFLDNRNNVISPDKVLIDFIAPKVVDYGKTIPVRIQVANTNTVPLRNAVVTLEYPSGVQNATAPTERVYKKIINTIESGSAADFDLILDIRSGSDKPVTLPLLFEYSVPDSNARFTLTRSTDVAVREVPIGLAFQSPNNISVGSPTTVALRVTNKDPSEMHDIQVEITYPRGFTVQAAIPKANTENAVSGGAWLLKNVSPGETRNIQLKGIFSSAREVVLTIRASAALIIEDTYMTIASTSAPIALNKAFIAAEVILRGGGNRERSHDIIAEPNSRVSGVINWQSLASEVLRNVEIAIRFSGNGINIPSLETENRGVFDGNRQQVTWNSITNPELDDVSPGQQGDIEFNFKTLPAGITELETQHRYVTMDLIMRGITVAGRRDTISFPGVARVRLSTVLSLFADTRYRSGRLENTGPPGLAVGEETTFSLYYFIKNQGNTLRDLTLYVPLTAQTIWKGVTIPDAEQVVYDVETHSFRWDVGQVPGLGAGSSRTLEVQVGIIPTVLDTSSRNRQLPLTKQGRFYGADSFTQQSVSSSVTPLTTHLTER